MFIKEDINAPHFCDFREADNLKQYSEEELRPIFGCGRRTRITPRKHERALPLGAICG